MNRWDPCLPHTQSKASDRLTQANKCLFSTQRQWKAQIIEDLIQQIFNIQYDIYQRQAAKLLFKNNQGVTMQILTNGPRSYLNLGISKCIL